MESVGHVQKMRVLVLGIGLARAHMVRPPGLSLWRGPLLIISKVIRRKPSDIPNGRTLLASLAWQT